MRFFRLGGWRLWPFSSLLLMWGFLLQCSSDLLSL
jgi:hypothetical protein